MERRGRHYSSLPPSQQLLHIKIRRRRIRTRTRRKNTINRFGLTEFHSFFQWIHFRFLFSSLRIISKAHSSFRAVLKRVPLVRVGSKFEDSRRSFQSSFRADLDHVPLVRVGQVGNLRILSHSFRAIPEQIQGSWYTVDIERIFRILRAIWKLFDGIFHWQSLCGGCWETLIWNNLEELEVDELCNGWSLVNPDGLRLFFRQSDQKVQMFGFSLASVFLSLTTRGSNWRKSVFFQQN